MPSGSYQDRCVGGEMWRFHCLSWSSFYRFLLTYGWHVSVVASMHGLENAFALVEICTRSPNSFSRGLRRMTIVAWTYGVDDYMTTDCELPGHHQEENCVTAMIMASTLAQMLHTLPGHSRSARLARRRDCRGHGLSR